MARHGWTPAREIEHPDAYANAVKNRIRMNANTTRRRKMVAALAADSQEFRQWLDVEPLDVALADEGKALWQAERVANEAWGVTLQQWRADGGKAKRELTAEEQVVWDTWQAARRANEDFSDRYQVQHDKAVKAFFGRYGTCPKFLKDAILEWGGLSDGQLAFARKTWAERVERATKRDAEREALRASAQAWQAGRQLVQGTVISIRETENDYGLSVKLLVQVDNGAKLWVSCPSACVGVQREQVVRMSVNVEPSTDDPTFAFGSRPTKASIITAE
jgi:hypothetical protein